MPQIFPVARYSFQPDPERYPRTTHSIGSGCVLRTTIERPASSSAILIKRSRKLRGAQNMVGNHVVQQIEPEQRELCQHAPFVGNGRGHDDIKRRKPVGGDNQQPVAEIINVADLAARDGGSRRNSFRASFSLQELQAQNISPDKVKAF